MYGKDNALVTNGFREPPDAGPAAGKCPAQDNLDAMQEWSGDPIAAQHDLWPPLVL